MRHHAAMLEAAEYVAPIYAPPARALPSDAYSTASTATAAWACIRLHEDGGTYHTFQSGAYGFEPATSLYYFGTTDAASVSNARQDAAALAIFHANGDRWSGAWSTAAACGLP